MITATIIELMKLRSMAMKSRLKLITAVILVVVSVSLVGVRMASAQNFRSGDNVTVGANERVDDTLYVAGRTVDINSEVFGDIFCAGQNVTVSGTVHGDVICAGQTVNVTGTVDGDVRLAGQTVTLGAEVSGNATVGGQTFNLESTGRIAGDLTIGSTDATLNGSVGRNVAAGNTNLTVAGAVGGRIKASVTNLTLASGARVNGDIEYSSWNNASQSEGAVIGGSLTRKDPPRNGAPKRGAIFGFGVMWFVYWLSAMLFTALALALLFPRLLHNVTDHALPRPWKSLLAGFIASLAVPAILIVLMVTVLGIPLAVVLGLIWLVLLLLSGPVFGYYIGRLVLSRSSQPLLIMLTGASILLVAYFIPIVGFLSLLAATWFGTGMMLLELFKRTPKPEYDLAPAQTTRRKK